MPARVDPVDGELFCPKCQKTKRIEDFYLYQGRAKRPCKECKNTYQRDYYVENVEDIGIYRREYYIENREELIAEQLMKGNPIYQENDQELIKNRKRYRSKYHTLGELIIPDVEIISDLLPRKNNARGRLKSSFTRRITRALVKNGSKEIFNKITIYLPYTNEELDNHIENQFEWWMHWENWGVYDPKIWKIDNPLTWTWQVDHIEPHSKFKYKSLTDQLFLNCWSLNNLRPYSARQNVLDKDRRHQLK
jgi:hypothetical protein